MVFGGLDGIIAAFASVAAVVGANYSTTVIFVLVRMSIYSPCHLNVNLFREGEYFLSPFTVIATSTIPLKANYSSDAFIPP